LQARWLAPPTGEVPAALEAGERAVEQVHGDLAAGRVLVAGGEALPDAAERDADLGLHAGGVLLQHGRGSHQGRNLGYWATSVTRLNISSALYQISTERWTVFIQNAGSAGL
jgi:hypothetical protein